MKQQLIFLAPMQLRRDLALGNIYSALVADMYNKVLKVTGVETYFPLTLNVVGKKTEDLLLSLGVELSNKQSVEKSIKTLVEKVISGYRRYFIDFDCTIRDDLLTFRDLEFNTNFGYILREVTLKTCSQCNENFGTDLSILKCKSCGETLTEVKEERLSIEVDNLLLLKQIEKIYFYPDSKRNELGKIIESFPKKCVFCLEKERKLTVYHDGRPLDPKLIALQTLVTSKMKSGFFDPETTLFQGDVLKKFTYYSLAYLGSGFFPERVVCHGLILGSDGKKLRAERFLAGYLDSLPPKLLRAFLLSFKIGHSIRFSEDAYHGKAVGLIRLINKIKIMLEYDTHDKSPRLFLKDEFVISVLNLNYSYAYQLFVSLVNKYWKLTRSAKLLNEDDKIWIRQVAQLYFGLF